jgi:cytochrome P450
MCKSLWTKARSIVDQRRARGGKRDFLLGTKLDEYAEKGWPFPEWVINYLFSGLVEGGADTTANHLLAMILALASHPHVQKRAREEIDAVCGTERARLSDCDKLPYVNALSRRA